MKKMLMAALAGVLLAAPAISQSWDSHDRRVEVHNKTGGTVYYLYISNVGRGIWGPDQLRSGQVIGPGERVWFNVDDGDGYCRFDFKATFSNDAVRTGMRINVCAASHIDITADGIFADRD